MASTQAQRIIDKFGGVPQLAQLINRMPQAIYRWTYPASRGGTDGYIPTSAIDEIKAAALMIDLPLTAEDWAP